MFQGSLILLGVAVWYATITQAFVYAYNFNNIYAFCLGMLVAYLLPSVLIRQGSQLFYNIKNHKIIHNDK